MSSQDLPTAQQLFSAGRLDEAEAICQKMLQDQPRHVEALCLLGALQSVRGDCDKAITTLTLAIDLKSNDASLHRQLGDLYFRLGNIKQSIVCYQRAAQLDPQDSEIRNNLGVALRQLGQLPQATEAFKEALRLSPERPLPYKNLAEVYHRQGQLEQALYQNQKALKIDPSDPTTLNSMGIILHLQGNSTEAIEQFQKALELEATFAEAENNLANALAAERRYQEALNHIDRALCIKRQYPSAHITKGNILAAQGNADLAAEEYQKGIDLDPDNVIAHQSLGSILTGLGKFDQAVHHLEEALHLDPNLVVAYQNLAALAEKGHYQFSEKQLDEINRLLRASCQHPAVASRLHFTIGHLLNKEGKYDAAMQSFHQANSLQEQLLKGTTRCFLEDVHRTEIDKLIRCFGTGAWDNKIENAGNNQVIPIFVVGMPRSGTTLVEQIIASHPSVASTGGFPYVARLAEAITEMFGEDFPASISQATKEQLTDLSQHYWSQLGALGAGTTHIVDKVPQNFLYLGLIALLFPQARIVHCCRDALDVGISCYLGDFGEENWTGTLENIGQYYLQYERLMKHWQKVLPLQIHAVDYEALVANQERVSRDLLSFCGLEWSDVCLEFYNANTTVQSLSRVQVRQPVYRTAIGRWKNYQKHLQPLVAILQSTSGEKVD